MWRGLFEGFPLCVVVLLSEIGVLLIDSVVSSNHVPDQEVYGALGVFHSHFFIEIFGKALAHLFYDLLLEILHSFEDVYFKLTFFLLLMEFHLFVLSLLLSCFEDELVYVEDSRHFIFGENFYDRSESISIFDVYLDKMDDSAMLFEYGD